MNPLHWEGSTLKPGVEEECIGGLCVVVTVRVKVTEFVQGLPCLGNIQKS